MADENNTNVQISFGATLFDGERRFVFQYIMADGDVVLLAALRQIAAREVLAPESGLGSQARVAAVGLAAMLGLDGDALLQMKEKVLAEMRSFAGTSTRPVLRSVKEDAPPLVLITKDDRDSSEDARFASAISAVRDACTSALDHPEGAFGIVFVFVSFATLLVERHKDDASIRGLVCMALGALVDEMRGTPSAPVAPDQGRPAVEAAHQALRAARDHVEPLLAQYTETRASGVHDYDSALAHDVLDGIVDFWRATQRYQALRDER